ncbi:hypothetical protein [Pseudorhodobacter sp.]|uniref:hypothetical protein n=1 Tax=Pseudorhodobacter sp. TaxID=1934400 RepID=UPI002AFF35C5|nr:hypothetical protein [Pseudorhodobacter sp.]
MAYAHSQINLAQVYGEATAIQGPDFNKIQHKALAKKNVAPAFAFDQLRLVLTGVSRLIAFGAMAKAIAFITHLFGGPSFGGFFLFASLLGLLRSRCHAQVHISCTRGG